MIDPKTIDELTRRVLDALPQGIDRLHEDLRENIRAGLSASLAGLNLVGREEFDVQTEVLARTREKLEILEGKLKALETDLKGPTE